MSEPVKITPQQVKEATKSSVDSNAAIEVIDQLYTEDFFDKDVDEKVDILTTSIKELKRLLHKQGDRVV